MTQAQATKLIDNGPELDKAIAAWGAKGKKWAAEGHVLAMSALTLMSKANDTGPMNRLLLAMPKGTKVTSMKEWMLAFAPLEQNEGQDSATKPMLYKKDGEYDLVGAAKTPWFNFSPETAQSKVFDVKEAIEAIIKKSKGKELVHGELLTKLQELAIEVEESEVPATGDESEVPAATLTE
jgi:hypothetical protein